LSEGDGATAGRRAAAPGTAAAILDAAEALLDRGARLTMAALAGEAGISRPTLYAHYASVAEVVEAAVERSVVSSLAAFDAARPEEGPAPEALERMLAVAMDRLGRFDALARGAAEHLGAGAVHRTHAPLMERVAALVARGRDAGSFRTDLPAEWLVSMFPTLAHGADEHARAHGLDRDEAVALLARTGRDVFLRDPGAPGERTAPV
jgi:AcrR family transcriptional regulator